MNTFSSFAEGMILKAVPSLLTSFVGTNLLNGISTSGDILNMALSQAGSTTQVTTFNKNEKYISMSVPNLPDLGTSKQRQAFEKYTIFGDVDENGALRAEAKGGKLIQSINDLSDFGK
jgi:putative membrane protein